LFETFDKSDIYLREIIRFLNKADAYQTIPHDDPQINFNYGIYKKIWKEAEGLRKSGELLSMGERINCPVVVIHGDYDPHPYEGVVIPLARTVKDFKYEIIEKCGHHPWFEEHAKDLFYELLKKELT
jgi:pimeloyl-ACP methyl ester carboxylesterase